MNRRKKEEERLRKRTERLSQKNNLFSKDPSTEPCLKNQGKHPLPVSDSVNADPSTEPCLINQDKKPSGDSVKVFSQDVPQWMDSYFKEQSVKKQNHSKNTTITLTTEVRNSEQPKKSCSTRHITTQNARRMRVKRVDPEYRNKERLSDILNKRKRRQDADKRQEEKSRDAKARREKRKTPQISKEEQETNT